MRWRVVPAFGVMMASRSPTSRFISVDLPTFGMPMMETKPARCGAGSALSSTAARTGCSRGATWPRHAAGQVVTPASSGERNRKGVICSGCGEPCRDFFLALSLR